MTNLKYINNSAIKEFMDYINMDSSIYKNKEGVLNSSEIYHYTSPNGFYSILDKSNIWFTDSRFLNDVEEQYNIKYVIKEVLNKYSKNCKKNIIEILEPYTNDDVLSQLFDKNKRYIFSCSSAKDELALWNYYIKLNNNRGYSLCINPKNLYSDFEKKYYGQINVYKCLYSYEEKEKYLIDIIKKTDNALNARAFQNKPGQTVLDVLAQSIFTLSIIFKNEKFSSEKEIRFIYNPKLNSQKIKYRLSNGIIIPFVELSFIPKNSIKEVMIGPGNQNNVVLVGAKEFLHSKEIYIDVTPSLIPLRTQWNI